MQKKLNLKQLSSFQKSISQPAKIQNASENEKVLKKQFFKLLPPSQTQSTVAKKSILTPKKVFQSN